MTDSRNRAVPMDDATFARLWNNHAIPTKAIALHLGISRSGVSWRARNLGLPPRTKLRKTRIKDKALFVRLWDAGVSVKEIANHFGLKSHSRVCHCRASLGLDPRARGAKGGFPPNTPIAEVLDVDAALLAMMARDPAASRAGRGRQ